MAIKSDTGSPLNLKPSGWRIKTQVQESVTSVLEISWLKGWKWNGLFVYRGNPLHFKQWRGDSVSKVRWTVITCFESTAVYGLWLTPFSIVVIFLDFFKVRKTSIDEVVDHRVGRDDSIHPWKKPRWISRQTLNYSFLWCVFIDRLNVRSTHQVETKTKNKMSRNKKRPK